MIRVYVMRLRDFGNSRRENQRKTADALAERVCGAVPIRAENGRPLLEHGFISISHSGAIVACAVSEDVVGLDVEELRERSEKLWVRAGVHSYEEWCKKEAYVKFLGSGFTVPPSQVELGDVWFSTTQMHGYQVAVCSACKRAIELHWEVEENVWETALLHR